MAKNRIKELRVKNGLSQKELASKIDASNQIISFYENGKREPKIEMWQKLATFFNVSVPYLQGLEDKPNNGYSKEYIYKLLDDMYKEDWMNEAVFEQGLGNKIFDRSHEITNKDISFSFFARSTIQIYCENNGIQIPQGLARNFGIYDFDFWQKNFSFIFDDSLVKKLLTTKDIYTDDEIKRLILSAIAIRNTGYTTEQVLNKLKQTK